MKLLVERETRNVVEKEFIRLFHKREREVGEQIYLHKNMGQLDGQAIFPFIAGSIT